MNIIFGNPFFQVVIAIIIYTFLQNMNFGEFGFRVIFSAALSFFIMVIISFIINPKIEKDISYRLVMLFGGGIGLLMSWFFR